MPYRVEAETDVIIAVMAAEDFFKSKCYVKSHAFQRLSGVDESTQHAFLANLQESIGDAPSEVFEVEYEQQMQAKAWETYKSSVIMNHLLERKHRT